MLWCQHRPNHPKFGLNVKAYDITHAQRQCKKVYIYNGYRKQGRKAGFSFILFRRLGLYVLPTPDKGYVIFLISLPRCGARGFE